MTTTKITHKLQHIHHLCIYNISTYDIYIYIYIYVCIYVYSTTNIRTHTCIQ